MLGYFLGSMLPSPAYIADLQRIPLLMNTPEDVSLLVKRHLPDDAYKVFEIAANSSSNISIRKEEKVWLFFDLS
ncbi:hypothetical protein QW131_15320 [Roseibium salinum]|nr:hypothetical protein [Roseibium salinum]